MKKAELKALEKIFEREISNTLPLQSKAKIYLDLEKVGMVEKMTRHFPADRFGPIEISGWGLTLHGHMAYCQSCGEEKP
jgi:hypothetical protein